MWGSDDQISDDQGFAIVTFIYRLTIQYIIANVHSPAGWALRLFSIKSICTLPVVHSKSLFVMGSQYGPGSKQCLQISLVWVCDYSRSVHEQSTNKYPVFPIRNRKQNKVCKHVITPLCTTAEANAQNVDKQEHTEA
jgi:hypothetical protein